MERNWFFNMARKRLNSSLAGVRYHALTSPYCKNFISITIRCPFVTLLTPWYVFDLIISRRSWSSREVIHYVLSHSCCSLKLSSSFTRKSLISSIVLIYTLHPHSQLPSGLYSLQTIFQCRNILIFVLPGVLENDKVIC